ARAEDRRDRADAVLAHGSLVVAHDRVSADSRLEVGGEALHVGARYGDGRRDLLRVGDVTALREERLVEREVNALEKLAALLGDALGSLQGGEAEARQLRVGPRGEADAVGRRHLGAPPPPLLAVGGLEGDPARGRRAEGERP